MKRSQINAIMKDADQFIKSCGFLLPPFAYWSATDWKQKGDEVRDIANHALGWDITDFGGGEYEKRGLFLFTVRNGHPDNLKRGEGKVYAEKIMIVDVNQLTPLHFHWHKTEDIINRGGGQLLVKLYNATEDGELKDTPVTVSIDGIERTVSAGDTIALHPGESVTLVPYCYHAFWAEGERVLVGEVSTVNDDHQDNRFYENVGRFPEIEEDEPPLYLLVGDYPTYFNPNAA